MFEVNEAFIQTLLLTLKLACVTTVFLIAIGILLAYLLTFTNIPCKALLKSLIAMPLVLPPSVLGFYLLITFSPKSVLGTFLKETFNVTLVFSFEGLVLASIIASLPFMVHPIQAAFESVSKSLIEASYTLGKSKMTTLYHVIIPNSKVGILSGIVIAFAHTIGEFGVVMMIGGHKQGETLVASIAIYDAMEALEYNLAHQYAFILTLLSFMIVLALYSMNKKSTHKQEIR